MSAPIRYQSLSENNDNPFKWDSNVIDFKGYNGSPNLKKSGIQVNFTQEMIDEWKKCKNDPIYFAEKYIKIVHVDHGLIPIQLYDYQKDIIRSTLKSRKVLVNTSRQIGKTTTATCILLHYVLFNKHKTVALLANKGDAALEVMNRIQLAYEYLPKWLQSGVIEWNKGSIELENGSKIIASATSSSAIRGKSVNWVYVDECISGNTNITVRNKITGEISQIKIEDLYESIAINNNASRGAGTPTSSNSTHFL